MLCFQQEQKQMLLNDPLHSCISCVWVSVYNLTSCVPLFVSLTSLGRSLWHSQERHRHRCHVRHEARAHHEVHHPRRHGGYHSHLRFGGCGADCQQHCREARPPQVSPAHVWLHAGEVLSFSPVQCLEMINNCRAGSVGSPP